MNYYKTLRLTPNATIEEIERAVERLSSIWNPEDFDSCKDVAVGVMKDVMEARDVLVSQKQNHLLDGKKELINERERVQTIKTKFQSYSGYIGEYETPWNITSDSLKEDWALAGAKFLNNSRSSSKQSEIMYDSDLIDLSELVEESISVLDNVRFENENANQSLFNMNKLFFHSDLKNENFNNVKTELGHVVNVKSPITKAQSLQFLTSGSSEFKKCSLKYSKSDPNNSFHSYETPLNTTSESLKENWALAGAKFLNNSRSSSKQAEIMYDSDLIDHSELVEESISVLDNVRLENENVNHSLLNMNKHFFHADLKNKNFNSVKTALGQMFNVKSPITKAQSVQFLTSGSSELKKCSLKYSKSDPNNSFHLYETPLNTTSESLKENWALAGAKFLNNSRTSSKQAEIMYDSDLIDHSELVEESLNILDNVRLENENANQSLLNMNKHFFYSDLRNKNFNNEKTELGHVFNVKSPIKKAQSLQFLTSGSSEFKKRSLKYSKSDPNVSFHLPFETSVNIPNNSVESRFPEYISELESDLFNKNVCNIPFDSDCFTKINPVARDENLPQLNTNTDYKIVPNELIEKLLKKKLKEKNPEHAEPNL